MILVEDKSVRTSEAWEKVIEEEYVDLGLNDNAKQIISRIIIDCK